jgi:two-component system, OmpR family, copper resistance phosphate regulon response regulator CusR
MTMTSPISARRADRRLRQSTRVLVIEDEPRIADVVRTALEAEALAVDVAADGVAGLQAALTGDHQLVVLDLVLPGQDGLAVLAQLRRRRPELPVLILSARSELATKLRGFELGATDYLTKPFSVDELVARVRIQLRRFTPQDDAVLDAGPLALDLIRRQARQQDRTVDLTDREFNLLRCLLGRAGSVVTREQLLADVWGIEFDPGTNVVEVCVRRLRRKLGASAIETVRNVGYRVAPD